MPAYDSYARYLSKHLPNAAVFLCNASRNHVRTVLQPRRIFADGDPFPSQPFQHFMQLLVRFSRLVVEPRVVSSGSWSSLDH